jgi:glycosyltransferase involved in cell wall biosynthesis
LTKEIEEAITLAKKLNKKVLFDIDDLVFDTNYTNLNTYVKNLSKSEKSIYDKGVILMGKTLKLCEGAITTTEALAKELKKYVPEVFINRNVASEEMWRLSQKVLENKTKIIKNSTETIIGYFSGSISHNPDFQMIVPYLTKILQEFKNVKLLTVGELNYHDNFKNLSAQIIKKKFVDWKELPELIGSVDINIAPIEDNVFNEAKSENKWVEAALVKVPTVASNIGAFKETIIDGKTGLLCTKPEEWYNALKILIKDKYLRKTIGSNAFEFCKEKYNALLTGSRLVNYINSISSKHIGFLLPSTQISGGAYVVLAHASLLQDSGWDVDIIFPFIEENFIEFKGHKFNAISIVNSEIDSEYDVLVATFYSTLAFVLSYTKVKRRLYLVQGYETDFYTYGSYLRNEAEKTYSIHYGIEYITISKWCETWLRERYKQKPKYIPNGIEFNSYMKIKRNLTKKKIRILIEGDSLSPKKNIDESFKIVEKLDKNKFEIWYMSYNGWPKDWYRVDKFLSKIPYEKVKSVYEQCDILLKSSYFESFSFPPLEMMASGGYCIVIANEGNVEYLRNEENCLFYKLGDIDSAVQSIKRLISDKKLQDHLYNNGLLTAKQRDWKNFQKQILSLYKE